VLVFWKEALVLLAVPKTGTTALEGALAPRASMVLRDPPILKHSPVYRYRRFLAPYFKQAGGLELETVAVVRHPVDWLASWYRYRHRDDIAGHRNSTRGVSFDAFVEEYMKGKPAAWAEVGSQAKFLCDGEGNCAVDHLFRYEAQGRLVAFLEDRLKMTLDLPRLNVSPQVPVDVSPDTLEKFKRKCSAEFAIWEDGQA